ncbi:MAG: restriction endonuclease subunit S [Bacteroides sp.]|nr:restriction endonuclease subunit S [Bacteroides sp.]
MKAERRSEFAFLTDSSDVTVGIMSRPLRLLIRSSLMVLHWVVSNNVLACSNTVSKNISFIVFATSIMNFSVREINDNLEAMAKQLYDYWFVQFDFPNEEGKPYKSSGGVMVWNEKLKRMIPQGWNNGLLSDVAIITMGQSPDGSSYNELGEGSIFYQGSTDFGLRFPSIRQYTTSPNRCANKGDILMSVRAPVGALNIANNDCCIGRGLSALSSKIGSTTHLYYLMNDFRLKFEGMNSAGTTFGSITKDELFNLPVVIPTKSVISEFEKVCEPIFDKQMIIGEEINVLTKQRDELLPLLMNGQASVNSD